MMCIPINSNIQDVESDPGYNGLLKIAAGSLVAAGSRNTAGPQVVAGRGRWVPRAASPRQGQHTRPRVKSLKVHGSEPCGGGGQETDR